jgi:hypothetical protein
LSCPWWAVDYELRARVTLFKGPRKKPTKPSDKYSRDCADSTNHARDEGGIYFVHVAHWIAAFAPSDSFLSGAGMVTDRFAHGHALLRALPKVTDGVDHGQGLPWPGWLSKCRNRLLENSRRAVEWDWNKSR